MDIRQAILKAADHIEANPDQYDFDRFQIPACGTPGCMAGWVGHFLGMRAGASCWQESPGVEGIFGISFKEFQRRRFNWFLGSVDGTYRCQGSASDAAEFLRYYADKYHPAHEDWPDEEYPEIRAELDRIAGMGIEKSGTGIAA